MFGLTDRQLFAFAVVVYGVSTLYSLFLWRRGFRKDNRIIYLLLFVALGLQSVAMAKRGFSLSRCPVTNLFEATIFSTWAIGATYMVLGLVRRLRFLGAFMAPLLFGVGVFALMPGLDAHGPQPEFRAPLSSLHASLIMLAYGAFGLGAVAGVMYLTQERDLKQHKLRAVLAILPSIQRIEAVASGSLAAGLALLSCGMVLGALWLKHEKGVFFVMDAKILWTLFVWLGYLVLLVRRWRFDRGGRRFAWGAIVGFGFILSTFTGFNLLSGIHHP